MPSVSQENSPRLSSQLCIFPRKRIPRRPSGNFTGLYIFPEAEFIVAGDFNKANLRSRLPKFYQHIDCSTRASDTLNRRYSNFRDSYKALPCPSFDHDSKNRPCLGLSNGDLTNRIPRFKIALITWTGICSGYPQTITLTHTLTL